MEICIPLYHPRILPFFKNKHFEFQIDKHKDGDYFRFILKWTRNTDHAGPSIYLEVFGLFLALDIYDNRHWNYDEERWEDCDMKEER